MSLPQPPAAVRALPRDALASILDQSVDCVKLIGLDERVRYMNWNGQCAMEVDDLCAIIGQPWADLWPDAARPDIAAACAAARRGAATRFDAYCPTRQGTPKWWNVSISPVRGADGGVDGILSISRDVTDAELARQALEITTEEMRHRLKNSYAMVASLLATLSRGAPEREEFAREMGGRLAALATAQTLRAAQGTGTTRLSQLIPAVVIAFDSAACPVTVESLHEAGVDQGQADAIALVLGELSVNSAKHGALGGTGHVRICAEESDGRIVVLWSERSDRRVVAQARDGGQGLRLMDRIVRARHGTLRLDWHDFGLDVRLEFAAVRVALRPAA